MLYASDLITQYIPWYYITAQYIHRFQLPIWVPNIYGAGYPLLAEGEIGTLSPINSAILFIFPFTLAISLLYLTYLAIAGTGSYLFLKLNKFSSLSSLLGALTFCLSGYMVTRYFQPSIIFTAALVPFGFYIIQKSLTHPKFTLLLAPLIYLQITAGHLQIAAISITAYLTFAILVIIQTKKWPVGFLKISLAVFLGLALASVQILPSIKLYQLSQRKSFDPAIRFSYSLPPSQLITYIRPYAFGISKPGDDLGFRQFGGGFWEINLTIWTIPFLLSLIPLFKLLRKPKEIIRENKMVAILYFVWILFILISLGGFFKPYRIVAHIPDFPFRAPARFLVIATFAASSLAAIGFEKLTANFKKPQKLLLFLLVIASIAIQQQKLFQGYIITKNSSQVIASLKNLDSYRMTTPLSLNPASINPLLEKAFYDEFRLGLLISLASLLVLYLWYRMEKS
ncbi:MAG: hypothetical protein UT84_C0003G0048 [Candidatus Curtissbacteria bacterium GW2011_GWA1_40_16]|uniref:Membrane protein 6-pyruvoyl-tetrahydropterin synthase-related domain-containing protein n=1 Tax=Candidatus Curtissbacteria bacterium GW2011_GWA1_40_16 TaxID=1618405 RepID=A0A0G0RF24_9BACT|nr:MAG: hypothetical protein UT84_C0003G0048 [Candidatus Curtissbacteria bacterium GW2011_GWA1_40_16]